MCNVMFSGGIPADSVEGVYDLLASTVGDRAAFWPDGEINPERRGWIGAINAHVLATAPCFEPVPSPLSLPRSHPYHAFRTLKIRDGAEVDLRGRLPYARDAIASYRVFRAMQAEGRIPAGVRFQCTIPGAHDVISITFPDVSTWPRLIAAWQEAVQEEYRRMLEVIPAEALCVQVDYCTEMIHIGGTWAEQFDWVPNLPRDTLFARYTAPDYIRGHLQGLPEAVTVGFHVCCGTSPSYPVQELDDIGLPVDLSNAIQAAADGRVDYFHLPAMTDSGDHYFAPLARLATGRARIYLGLECNDGVAAMARRMQAARPYLRDFGVAHYCGYFWNKEIMPELLDTLTRGADLALAARGSDPVERATAPG